MMSLETSGILLSPSAVSLNEKLCSHPSNESKENNKRAPPKINPLIIEKKYPRPRPIIYRKLYPGITADWLDRHFSYYLISGEESWSEVPRRYWFRIQNKMNVSKNTKTGKHTTTRKGTKGAKGTKLHQEGQSVPIESTSMPGSCSWWDIRQLLLQITQCLNSSNMGSSYPQFPHDPFTRCPIPYDELVKVYQRAIELQLDIHCSTLVFLYWVKGKDSRKPNNRWKRTILDTKQMNMILSTWLRFRNINSQDSQGNFIGIWEPKSREIDLFERSYRQYCQQPPFAFEFGIEIVNPRRKILEDLLQRLPKEEWNIEDHSYSPDTNPYLFNPKSKTGQGISFLPLPSLPSLPNLYM